MKLFLRLAVILVVPLMLTGCLSHWFLESSSRLQIENATEEYSIVGVDVLGSDGTSVHWVTEAILPGEKSRVVEEDWVGDFKLRFKYTKSVDGSGEIIRDEQNLTLDGGSLYLVIESKGDSLTYRFR